MACSDPVGVANAEILTSSPYSNGDLVTYRCLSGFTMDGTPSQECLAGVWQGTAPTCNFVSLADLHEQHVDFSDDSGDNTMTYAMVSMIAAVFLVMMTLLVLVVCFLCRKIQCFNPKEQSNPNDRLHMRDVVDRVIANNRSRPAKEVKGWLPFQQPKRDINTSTK